MCSCLASGVCALILTSSGKTVCREFEKNRDLSLLCVFLVVLGGYPIQFSIFSFLNPFNSFINIPN